MSQYTDADKGVYGARPIELYSFTGAFVARYTTAQVDTVYNFQIYTSDFIRMSELKWTDDVTQQAITIELKADNPLAQDFVVSSPAQATYLTVRRHILGINDYPIIWRGVLVTPEITAEYICKIRCEPLLRGMNRMGLRPMYQVPCRHPLYGVGCGVNRASYRVQTRVTAIAGAKVTVASTGGRALANGEFYHGSFARMIYDVSGNVLTLSAGLPSVAVGDAVDLYPGCAHTTSACQGFGNISNYGGFPWIPEKNPFTGDSLR